MLDFSLKKIRFINLFLAILISIAALFLIRDIIKISLIKKESHLIVPEDKTYNHFIPEKKSIIQYSPILEKNPFGPPTKLHLIAVLQETESQNGSLSNLILMGTAVGPKNLSYAIFVDKAEASSGKEEIFAYGENVFNYGVLNKIERSSVELKKDSVEYTITMPLEDTNSDKERQQIQSMDRSQTSFAKKVSERNYILDSRRVQRSLENPEQILTDARLLPNIKNGMQEGFTISEVVNGGLYHSLGLRNGDILLRINGLEISNPEVAIQAMSALRGMNRVNLDIIRNGKNMSMNYQIK